MTATPLLDALTALQADARLWFHMPGHARGRLFAPGPLREAGRLDTTELLSTDDLLRPQGPARDAMRLAARAFGAGQTWFLTGGSTAGVQVMVALAHRQRRTLLLPRAVHLSVLQAVTLTGIPYRFLPPGPDRLPLSPCRPPDPSQLEAVLRQLPDPAAVLVTSPDYYGQCADLSALAAVAHKHRALLLVDEAQGAHLPFGPGLLPPGAMASGADLCVQSALKMLPALTPAALLHLSSGALETGRVDTGTVTEYLRLFSTSSPSLLIGASLDYARAWMEDNGTRRIRAWRLARPLLAAALPAGFRLLGGGLLQDPIRFVMDTRDSGIPAPRILARLAGLGLDLELADAYRLIAMPALGAPVTDLRRLVEALRRIAEEEEPGDAGVPDPEMAGLLNDAPDRIRHPRDAAWPAGAERVCPLSEAAGYMAARALTPYPPGIPLVWPGERLDAERLDLLRRLASAGIGVDGVTRDEDGIRQVLTSDPDGCPTTGTDPV